MKQKIVIKLEMECDKCRNKALKIAAQVPGVTAVYLEGDEKDCVAVTGDNVDMVYLANQLKKKFRSVVIMSVEDLLKKAAEEKKKKEKEKEEKEEEEEKKKKVWCVHSSTCHGKCKKPECDGYDCIKICFKCDCPKCKGQCNPPSPCYRPCPQWCNCPKCYVPYSYPPRVVFESYSCPDNNTCSIM